ncbi:cation:proton antiporter [Sedimentibacter sp. MB31-C6]|uniref:cation:proton antiporter n=1 Tax=Sedimentibacter sp. MB31-C6 TaxID=3109366 RepID=UPI002DDD035C|nr:cation:proton antiporter [Sedimentibacter sp. MB36-C1]WSI04846.1 cation:proton antiporter [Sedimentibacter sp. MB36-C1]
MTTSLGIIVILGLLANRIFTKMRLPGLLGMLILGVIIGPYGLNWIDQELLKVSEDLRQIALIIILLRAGLGISKDDLNKVGRTAIKLSCIPGLIEGFTIAFLSMKLLGFTFIQGGILGFIIAAVSPAVVVPQMLELIDKKIGVNKSIPTLILAGASIDDVFAITVFTTFLGLYSGKHVNIGIQILNIPVSIILGVILGFLIGLIMIKSFKKYFIRDTKKVLLILGSAILLTAIEDLLKDKIEVASLLGVMTIGFIILEKTPKVAKRLSVKFNKIWIFAEILLFVLVGSQVNINVAFNAGSIGLIIIFVGLIGRSFGVILSTLGTDLNWKERLFCAISYLPKATVQAAIGAVPLSLGVKSGDIILAIAVLSILVTAPLGAIGIKASAKKLLKI